MATLPAAAVTLYGLTLYGLDKQPEFRDDLRLARVSEVVRVKSLTPKFPDYILASVAGPRGIRAVAMFTLGGDGPEFAAVNVTEVNLQHVTRFTAADAQSRFGGTTQGTPELVWAWSTASQSPFAPLWRVSRNESSVFLLNDGTTATELQLE